MPNDFPTRLTSSGASQFAGRHTDPLLGSWIYHPNRFGFNRSAGPQATAVENPSPVNAAAMSAQAFSIDASTLTQFKPGCWDGGRQTAFTIRKENFHLVRTQHLAAKTTLSE